MRIGDHLDEAGCAIDVGRVGQEVVGDDHIARFGGQERNLSILLHSFIRVRLATAGKRRLAPLGVIVPGLADLCVLICQVQRHPLLMPSSKTIVAPDSGVLSVNARITVRMHSPESRNCLRSATASGLSLPEEVIVAVDKPDHVARKWFSRVCVGAEVDVELIAEPPVTGRVYHISSSHQLASGVNGPHRNYAYILFQALGMSSSFLTSCCGGIVTYFGCHVD